VCNQGTAKKQVSIADFVIPVEKSQKKKEKRKKWLLPWIDLLLIAMII